MAYSYSSYGGQGYAPFEPAWNPFLPQLSASYKGCDKGFGKGFGKAGKKGKGSGSNAPSRASSVESQRRNMGEMCVQNGTMPKPEWHLTKTSMSKLHKAHYTHGFCGHDGCDCQGIHGTDPLLTDDQALKDAFNTYKETCEYLERCRESIHEIHRLERAAQEKMEAGRREWSEMIQEAKAKKGKDKALANLPDFSQLMILSKQAGAS